MKRFDRWVGALWSRYGLGGVVVVVLLLAALAWWFGVDVAGLVRGVMGA